MMRRSLVAAVAAAPLLLAMASVAHAATEIKTAVTTAQTTSTTGDLTIDSGASVSLSTAATPSVTINSNNEVINSGTISNGGVDNTTAVQINGGSVGTTVDVPTITSSTNPRAVLLNNTGAISITESYTATDSNADGVVDGPWSKQAGGFGVRVSGAGTATGDVINTGTITVAGNGGIGISIETELNGDLSSILITPTSTSGSTTTNATATHGSVSVVGDNAIGVSIAKTGHVTGNVTLGNITATGVGAQGASVLGNVDGALILDGTITAYGYRSLTPTSFTAATLATFTADELEQGGGGVVIGANVGNGVVVAAVPKANTDTSSTAVTAPIDADNNGIPDASQGGSIAVYGSAPAVQIGVTGVKAEIGASQVTDGSVYGFVNEGAISATGLYDQTSEPNLPAPVTATAIQIGVTGDATSGAVIDNGFHNTSSGTVLATAVDANSTGIYITTGGDVPRIVNDGTISAGTTVNNWVNSVTTTPAQVTATAILVDADGKLTSLTNTGAIAAAVSGTVNQANAGNIGSAYAIKDESGTLVNVANSGSITAVVTQTLTGTAPGTATITTPLTVAIDLSHSSGNETITQTQQPDILVGGSSTTAATATAVAAPSITGDILLGSGNDTVNIQAGTVTGAISFGAGANNLIIDGTDKETTGTTTVPVTTVTGAITADGGTLGIDIGRGELSVTNTATINATTVNVSGNGTLLISADPTNHANTTFITTGNSVIGAGATFGLTMKSLQVGDAQYVVIKTAIDSSGNKLGSITASTFDAGTIANAPFLYSASASYVAGTTGGAGGDTPDEIVLDVKQKTTQELGFNRAESQSYNAIFDALQHDSAIQAAVLAQTTKSGLIDVYDQMVPDQGQGLFDTLDQATQAVSNLTAQTPDAGTRVAGTSLWLQEVNERVKRASGDTLGSQSQLFGLVGGWEHMGAGGGALGLTFSYLNVQDRDSAAAVGEHTVGSLLEVGGYYRRAIGGLRVSARGAGGYAFFNENREFIYTGVSRTALSSWGGLFADAHFGVDYEVHLGRFYARPGISADYLYLRENGHTEHGGGNGSGANADDGFDLAIDSRASHRLSGAAIMTLGTQFGRTTWLRTEVSGGYRRIFSGDMGDTTARFTYSGATPFTLTGEDDKGGWFTVGFSLKGGTNLSYLALEGDADFRDGEQRYNLYISGRSMF